MLSESAYKILKKAVLLALLIAGFFVFSYQTASVSVFSTIYTIFLTLVASALTALLDLPIWLAAAAGLSLGGVSGYLYALVYFLLALLFYVAALRLVANKKQMCPLNLEIDDMLGAALLGFYSSYPFLLIGLKVIFIFALPVFYGVFLFLLRRFPRSKNIIKEVFDPGERIAVLFLPLISLTAVSYYTGIKVLPFVLLLALYPFKAFMQRFFRFDPREIVFKTAEYLAASVFSSKECLTSFKSLADAVSEARKDDFSPDDLYLIYLLSTLAWSSFSKTLYRQPDLLSADEVGLLRDNLLSLKRLLILAGFKEEIAEAVCLLYENYDGSGIPYGKNGNEIPLLSRMVRVMERYLVLTSWKEGAEPLTDRNAIEKLKEGSGILYDPNAVELLARIITPSESLAAEKELPESNKMSARKESGIKIEDSEEKTENSSEAGKDSADGEAGEQ